MTGRYLITAVQSRPKLKLDVIYMYMYHRLNLDVSPGDVVQVNADFDADKECFVVDNCHEESSVILYPDCLVSGTSVANSITCARK